MPTSPRPISAIPYVMRRGGVLPRPMRRTPLLSPVGRHPCVPPPTCTALPKIFIANQCAHRCGERIERCRWQRKRDERVAAVKILSGRRKAARKFWAPQQGHPYPPPAPPTIRVVGGGDCPPSCQPIPAHCRGRQSGHFLETGSLHPPLAALRRFPRRPADDAPHLCRTGETDSHVASLLGMTFL